MTCSVGWSCKDRESLPQTPLRMRWKEVMLWWLYQS
uniref:Uncharacterized protein n=1 Tax=Arundo donax TaxID=35708 RepID=A0A0A8Y484_ARUDO